MNFLFKVVNAAGTGTDAAVNSIVSKIVDNIISPIVAFVFVLATFMFVWGFLGYFMGGEDSDARTKGHQHILWGVIGMAIMVSVYGIIRFVAATVGVANPI